MQLPPLDDEALILPAAKETPINLDTTPGIEEPILPPVAEPTPLEKAVYAIAKQLGFEPWAWGLRDINIVIVFTNGKKMIFDPTPAEDGKYIQLV